MENKINNKRMSKVFGNFCIVFIHYFLKLLHDIFTGSVIYSLRFDEQPIIYQ